MLSRIYPFLILLIVSSLIGHSQDPPYIQYTTKNGFPASTVYSNIVQDADGIMWFPTDQGMVKYDGRSFELANIEGISNFEIINCKMDPLGTIWIVNNAGYIYSKEHKSKVFKPLINTVTNLPFQTYVNYGIAASSKSLWFYNLIKDQRILIRYDFQSNRALLFDNMHGPIKTVDNNIYIRDLSSRIQLIEQNGRIPKKKTVISSEESNEYYQTIFEIDKHPNLLLQYFNNSSSSAPNYFNIIDLKNNTKIVKDQIVSDLNPSNASTKNKILWASQSGIKVFNHITFMPNSDQNEILRNLSINSIKLDHENNLWVGTNNSGLILAPNISDLIKPINLLGKKSIASINYDETSENIWVGTNDGDVYQYYLDSMTKKITTINEKRQIYSIHELDNKLIIANNTENILFDLLGRKFLKLSFSTQVNKSKLERIKEIERINRSKFIANHPVGPIILDMNTREAIKISNKYVADRTFKFIRDPIKNKTYCFGINNSFNIDAVDESINDIHSMLKHAYNDVAINPEGLIWLITSENVYHCSNDTIRQSEIRSSSKEIYNCILADSTNIYIGSNKGVKIYNSKSFKLEYTLDRTKGLLNENITSILLLENHKLLIGTNSGLYEVDLTLLEKNNKPPHIIINTFRIWDTNLDPNKEHRLEHTENDVFIEFAPISFKAQGLEQSKYRLLGYDTTWTYVDADVNELRFPNLAPGDYTFQVKAVNEDLVESIQAKEVKFLIRRPLWQRWYFILGSVAFSSLIIGLLLTRRQRREHNRQTEKMKLVQQLDQLKEAALRSQMNPHFLFNSLNSIMKFLIDNDKRASMDYLTRFSQLIRFVFEYSQAEEITLEEEIEFLKTYLSLEELRFGSKIEIDIDVDPLLPLSYVKLPPLLLQPIVENAFKHGLLHKESNGHLKIYFSEINQNTMQVVIADDGIGREQSALINKTKHYEKKRSITSTHIISDRIKLYNDQHNETGKNIVLTTEDLNPTHSNSIGTKVTVKIKY